jgi:hypothetical protein
LSSPHDSTHHQPGADGHLSHSSRTLNTSHRGATGRRNESVRFASFLAPLFVELPPRAASACALRLLTPATGASGSRSMMDPAIGLVHSVAPARFAVTHQPVIWIERVLLDHDHRAARSKPKQPLLLLSIEAVAGCL